MDAGIWRLKCRKCGHVFEVEIEQGDWILGIVKTYECPNCRTVPQERPQDLQVHWHDILDYIPKKPRS